MFILSDELVNIMCLKISGSVILINLNKKRFSLANFCLNFKLRIALTTSFLYCEHFKLYFNLAPTKIIKNILLNLKSHIISFRVITWYKLKHEPLKLAHLKKKSSGV